MGKQATLNYAPEIIKQLGIAHGFPSPSCGSLLLPQCSGAHGVHLHATTQPQQKAPGFRNFLLAYGSGLDTITILVFIGSTVYKKKLKPQVIIRKILH